MNKRRSLLVFLYNRVNWHEVRHLSDEGGSLYDALTLS